MVLLFSEPYGVLLSTVEEFKRGQTVGQEEANLGWVDGREPGSSTLPLADTPESVSCSTEHWLLC